MDRDDGAWRNKTRNRQKLTKKSKLRKAAQEGDLATLETLIGPRTPIIPQDQRSYSAAAALNESDEIGHTPVSWAAFKGHADCVKALIEAKAHVDKADDNGRTPVLWAASGGHADCVKALIEAKADVDKADKYGQTPLSWAAEKGRADCVNAFIEAGADVLKADKDGRTPVSWAAEKGRADCVKALIEARADVNKTDKDGRPPVSWAAFEGHADCVKALIEAKAGVDEADEDRRTPVSWAAQRGYTDCVKALIEAGADVDKADYKGRTPVSWAAQRGHADCVNAFIEAGADVDKVTNTGRTPVLWAAQRGHADCVKALIEAGADVDKADDKGRTPVSWAAQRGHADCVNAFIEAEADPVPLLRSAIINADLALLDSYIAFIPQDKRAAAINTADEEGRTLAYLAATQALEENPWAKNEEYPCLRPLIFDHGAIFLSKHAALLTDREKHIRAAEFLVAAAVIVGSLCGYLLSGQNVTTTCDTLYDGLLLQPYLFDFVTVFLFKVIQFMFEEALVPGLDFLAFASDRLLSSKDGFKYCLRLVCRCCCRGKEAKRDEKRPGETSSASSGPAQKSGLKGLGETSINDASLRLTNANIYPDRESISDAADFAAVDNPMAPPRASRISSIRASTDMKSRGDIEMACKEQGPDSHGSIAAVDSPAPVVSPSAGATQVSFDQIVKTWRYEKYKKVTKVAPNYEGDDFWHQVPYLFLYLQTCTAVISIVVAAVHVDRSLSAWQQYTNFYAVVVNSGAPTQVFSVYKMTSIDGRKDQMKKLDLIWFFLAIPLLVLVIPFLTHIFPATVLFCWLVAPILVIAYSGRYRKHLDRHLLADFGGFLFCGARKTFQKYHFDLFSEIFLRFVWIFLFHSLYTYAALAYLEPVPMTGSAYIGIIARDLHLRSQSQCFVSRAAASSRGLVTLFSWF